MNLTSWVLFGAVAGFVAHISDSKPVLGGIVLSVLFGVAGSLAGGITASYLFGLNPIFDLPSFIIAIGFSMFLVFVHHTIFSRQRYG